MTPPTRRALLDSAELWGRRIENALLTVLLCGLIGLGSLQILLRNVFSAGISWADGGIRIIVLWLAVIGAVAAARDRRHLSIDLARRWLPERSHRAIDVFTSGFAAAISGLLAWYAFAFVGESRAFGDLLLGSVPAWTLQAVMPVGFALMAYRFGLRCLSSLLRRS